MNDRPELLIVDELTELSLTVEWDKGATLYRFLHI